MSGPDIWIDRAEAIWLDDLYANAEALYHRTSLPSHDHSHHLRVWNLCKLLLREIATFNPGIDGRLVEGVLIAAFFHDLGMAYSTREDHGHLGAELCLKWFKERGRKPPEKFDEVLQAIELHDRKDEQIRDSFRRETPPGILSILAVADDLEALGIIGIYRYAEIYLRRGISLEELGERILKNASNRFENISRACMLCGRIRAYSRRQYDELRHFFEAYNQQLKTVTGADRILSGPLGVINYIRKPGRDQSELEGAGKEVSDYFIKLKHELDQARLQK